MMSRYWRTQLLSFVFSLAIEYCVALAIAAYFFPSQIALNALFVLLAIWGVQLLIWIKNTIVSTAWYYFFQRKQLISGIETTLRLHMFPVYDDHFPDGVYYMERIAKDHASSTDQITYAAATLGQLEVLRQVRPSYALRLVSTLEAALDNYRRNPASVNLR